MCDCEDVTVAIDAEGVRLVGDMILVRLTAIEQALVPLAHLADALAPLVEQIAPLAQQAAHGGPLERLAAVRKLGQLIGS